ncbi:S-adenosyl-L-methionine-dependent methyltransferase [Thozetella sp. PMI_491]|nr:S-adenosyl-L-methionine-dependent methyltransferase [Thozetella sp. PMI_491]
MSFMSDESSTAPAGAGTYPLNPASAPGDGQPLQSILVDPGFEGDSGNDESAGGKNRLLPASMSISSTILEYRKLHGRTYQNFEGAEYWGPNDDKQNEGLDMNHHMMYLAFDNRLFLSPLKNPQKVLDVGTGTGIWAIDFADEFPSAEVTGTDLSPIQPAWVPPNCRFELDNCELDWTYPDETFDFIHIRGLVGSVKDWPRLYAEALRCLKPGGWFEQHEFALPIAGNDGPLPEDCIWHDWGRIFRDAGYRMGRSFEVSDYWEEWLRAAGFEGEIHRSEVPLPIGGWALETKWKQIGLFNRMGLEQGLEGFATYICTQVLGWEHEQVELMLVRVRQAIKNKTYHAYFPMKSIYIQKPLRS